MSVIYKPVPGHGLIHLCGCRAKPQSLFAKMGAVKKAEALGVKAEEQKGVGNHGGP